MISVLTVIIDFVIIFSPSISDKFILTFCQNVAFWKYLEDTTFSPSEDESIQYANDRASRRFD